MQKSFWIKLCVVVMAVSMVLSMAACNPTTPEQTTGTTEETHEHTTESNKTQTTETETDGTDATETDGTDNTESDGTDATETDGTDVTDTDGTDTTETESKETESKETESKETEPKETEPKETEPKETEPKETEPKETEPKETEPKETEPKETEPKETEPKETEPKETEPKETEPKETEPKETEPKETEPKETEPKETEPKDEPKETESKDESETEHVHDMAPATCTKPSTCTTCGHTEGEALGHKDTDEDYVCNVCEGYVMPKVGVAFNLMMFQAKKNQTLYFTGEMSTYYFATSEDVSEAVELFTEEVEGGYAIYFLNGTDKQYLYIEANGTHINVKYGSTVGVWEWNDELGVFTFDLNGTDYYVGTYSTYVTFSASKLSYISGDNMSTIDVSNFPGRAVPAYKAPVESEGTEPELPTEGTEPEGSEPVEPQPPAVGGGSADFNTIVTSNANGDSGYKNTYTTANGWVVKYSAIQTGGASVSNPQFPVIGPDNTHKAVCLNGKTSATGSLTSPTLAGGISKLTITYTKMFTDTKLAATITVTDLATGETYTGKLEREEDGQTKYVVWTYEFVLDTPITGDFTISVVNDCPSGQDGNKDRLTILSLSWEAPAADDGEDTESVDTEPEGTEPEGTEPEGTEPEGTEPEGTEPEGTEPEGTEPELPTEGTESETEHVHDMAPATCTNPSTCTSCGHTEGEKNPDAHVWGEDNTCDICAATKVTNETELTAALANGGKIVLFENITVANKLYVTKDTELVLNGKTLTMDMATGRLFNVETDGVVFSIDAKKEGSTVNYSGYGLVAAKSNDDTVIDVTVVINGGTFTGSMDNGAFIKAVKNVNLGVELYNVTYVDNSNADNANAGTKVSYITIINTDSQAYIDLTVIGGSYDADCGFYGHEAVIEDVTVNARGYCLYIINGSVDGCALTTTNTHDVAGMTPAACIATSSNGVVTVDNCTLTAKEGDEAVYVYTSGGTVELTDCDVTGIYTVLVTPPYEGATAKVVVDGDPVAEHHLHKWTDATCTTPKTCSCGATDGEALGHLDENGDFKCDRCSTKVLPADGSTLTVEQALAIAKLQSHDTYTTQKYYVTGIVTNVYNTKYGNFYVKDANGTQLCIYGLYKDGTRYDAMTYKPVEGDEVTVYGPLGAYETTYQMKNAELDDVVAHEHDYKDTVEPATCLKGGYTLHECTICGYNYKDTEIEALGHTTDNGTCERCGQTIGGDAPVNETFSADFNTVSGTNTSYVKTTTTAGWVATNCAIFKGGSSNSGSTFQALATADTRGFALNGKTSAKGSIVSPTLNNGISKITFKYANVFSESNGVDITVTIKQNGTAVATERLDNNSVTQYNAYEFVWDLTAEGVAVSGDFTIEITNNSPSNNSSKNKDRVVIWDLEWTTNK